MSDSAELTENLLSAQYQTAPQRQATFRSQQQQQQQPMMIPLAAVAPAPTLMNVTVPQGVMPGQLLQLQTPSGQVVSVAVPAGMAPGGVFQIQV